MIVILLLMIVGLAAFGFFGAKHQEPAIKFLGCLAMIVAVIGFFAVILFAAFFCGPSRY